MPEINPKTARSVVTRPTLKPAVAPVAAAAPTARVLSLDALRGFDMFWIIGGDKLVKTALDIIPQPAPEWVAQTRHQLVHAHWIGFTAWDLIMPLFLFVVGAAMPFSF